MVKKMHHKLKIFLVFFIPSAFIAICLGVYIFVQTNVIFAANFADDVLRPLIGSPATIVLEASFFKVQDIFNQAKYSITKPSVQISHIAKEKVINTDEKFLLKSIPPITNLPALAGEGVWTPINVGTTDAIMVKTFVRPDPQRDYAIVSIVKMNMNRLGLGLMAGTWEPGENFKRGLGMIPKVIQNSNMLVAAFNGGFKRTDGYYGMVIGENVFVPLKEHLATLIIPQGGKPKIINYSGEHIGDTVAIRQNGPMLIENRKDVSSSPAWNMQTWGLTTTNSMYTWRSGIGITKNGNLLYAVGPSLVPETLAKALLAAGAVSAMQLDINPVWVRFVLFQSQGMGKYTYQSLQNDMVNGGYEYLHGYQKDFFYVFKK